MSVSMRTGRGSLAVTHGEKVRRQTMQNANQIIAQLKTGDLDAATRYVLTAFQRHWRPRRIDGEPDQETLARVDGLLA